MKKILILTVAFFSLLSSCDDPPKDNIDDDLPGNFWALNFVNERFYRVDAELLASGSRCNVWVEKKSGVSVSTAQSIAYEYDTNIYNKMMSAFGENNISFNEKMYDTMAFADWLGDNDGKLCILVLDIKDGYKKGVPDNETYVAGYFWDGNFLNTSNTNQRDMIYLDTYPGMSTPEMQEEAYSTLAHEMQHLMNFVSTVEKRSTFNEKGQITKLYRMDTWIDEGLSSAAEWVYSGEQNQNRINWFNKNGGGGGLIDKGNNFFVWGNRENEKNYAVLDDYATVYIFFQWLRLQLGNTSIYKEIIISEDYDYRAVTNAAKKIDANYSTWSNLLRDWMAANYINNTSGNGRYGYKNDAVLSQIKAPYISSNKATTPLYPGEGVYSVVNNSYSAPQDSGNIKYSNLSSSGVGGTITSGALLTYNSDTNNYENLTSENGTITGNLPPPSPSVNISGGRFVGAQLSGPFPIGAGDVLRRKRNGESFFIKNFKSLKTDAVDE
jgi:hypothetical protein